MKEMWLVVCCVFVALVGSTEIDLDKYPDVIDMAYSLKADETLYFPKYPYGYNMSRVWRDNVTLAHGLWVEADEFSMIIHVGTHMDAPCHFCKTCWRMHEIPYENLRGPAAVINMQKQVAKNPNYELTVQDIQDWVDKNGAIPEGAFVMLNTGGQANWPDWSKFWGPDYLNGTYHFPGITQAATNYFLEKCDIKGMGADWGGIDNAKASSPDAEEKDYFYAHTSLLSRNKIIVEYVKNVELLPATGYTIYINPLNLYDTCGAPARMMAIKNPVSAAMSHHCAKWMAVLLVIVVWI